MSRAAALAAAAALLTLAPAATAAPWRTYEDAADGFSLAVPAGWQVVPRSVAAVRARAVRLQKRKQLALAYQYAAIAADRARAPEPLRFEAFQWPAPAGRIVPDVSVKIDTVAAGATAARIAKSYAAALGRGPGARVEAPTSVVLPAGRAAVVSGSLRLGGSKPLRSAYRVYLLLRGTRLYSLSFRAAPAQLAAESALVARIAAGFRFA